VNSPATLLGRRPEARSVPLGTTLLLLLVVLWPVASSAKDDWLPITPEELALKDNPASPGSSAMILYREMHTDDVKSFETHYYRIKIFTEEGKKYGDIQVHYWKGRGQVKDLKARVVQPNGTAVEFTGVVYDKVVAKYRDVRYMAKTFTLPDVQVGGIIEYQYRLQFDSMRLYDTRWTIQRELAIRRARLSIRPYSGGLTSLRWVMYHMPPGKKLEAQADDTYLLELENVPAFTEEKYMPPEDWLKMRIEFFYSSGLPLGPDFFWRRVVTEMNEGVDKFVDKRKELEREVAQVVLPGDTPETKLRKLYARAQQIENLSFQRAKSGEEEKREKRKDNKNVQDVLKNGYGSGFDINLLFLGLARAAGLEANLAFLSARSQYVFSPELFSAAQLNSNVVAVKLGNQTLFLDPATRFCPYNLLPWEESGVKGIRVAAEGDLYVKSPDPVSAGAVEERTAALRLDAEGNLEGSVQVVFAGQEALRRRLDALDEDDAGRKKMIEDEVKGWFPSAAQVDITRVTGWEGTEEPLTVEFTLHAPGFAVPTGRRLLLPLGIFQSQQQHPFQHAQRVHAIYFRHPYQEVDRVTIELPEGYRIESLPATRDKPADLGRYRIAAQNQPGQVQVERLLVISGFYFEKAYYSLLRSFYDEVKKGDESQAVLTVGEASGAK